MNIPISIYQLLGGFYIYFVENMVFCDQKGRPCGRVDFGYIEAICDLNKMLFSAQDDVSIEMGSRLILCASGVSDECIERALPRGKQRVLGRRVRRKERPL